MKNPLSTLLCAAVIGALSVTGLRAADAKPDAEGYIRNWLMLAPIPLGGENVGAEQIDKEQIEKEAALQPKAGDKIKVKDKELTWKAVQSKEAVFDFNETLGSPLENVGGYIVAYIVCEKELTDLVMLVGNNDQGRIYLNGKEVYKHADVGALEKDSGKAEKISLNKGVNVIVFKVLNENNNWQGCLRFTDKKEKPVTDYTVKLAP
ncbi:MAG: hypothetical protein EXS33_08425 [Pedosphaera sp.]|nr:hypothetical protein [Pedosphaera sp.]